MNVSDEERAKRAEAQVDELLAEGLVSESLWQDLHHAVSLGEYTWVHAEVARIRMEFA